MTALPSQPPRPLSPSDVPGLYRGNGSRRNAGQVWMVTFTDLVALMLTFFVLLFSMSRMDEVAWQNLKNALAVSLDRVGDFKVPIPDEELDINRITHVPGDDLRYLASVLREHMAEVPTLAASPIENLDDRLVLSLQVGRLFAGPGQELTGAGGELLFAIGGMLASLGNRIEVAGYVAALDGGPLSAANDWQRSLAQAQAVADGLIAAGYRDDILVRGHGSTETAPRSSSRDRPLDPDPAGRVDIIIRAHKKEAS